MCTLLLREKFGLSAITQGETIAVIKNDDKEAVPVLSPLTGVLRGIIHDGYDVPAGLKIADVDPRMKEQRNCFTISDKSRALGNAVLRALIMISRKKGIGLWS